MIRFSASQKHVIIYVAVCHDNLCGLWLWSKLRGLWIHDVLLIGLFQLLRALTCLRNFRDAIRGAVVNNAKALQIVVLCHH